MFGAWLNHDDSRGVNSLDMLVTEQNRNYTSSTTCSTSDRSWKRHGIRNAIGQATKCILEWKPGWLTLATLGLCATLDPDLVSRRRLPRRGDSKPLLPPELWKPEYPNAAFENMRPDDAFWAARIVAQFDAERSFARWSSNTAIQTRRPI